MISKIISGVGKRIPDFINRKFAKIPFKFRHGQSYVDFKKLIHEASFWNDDDIEKFVIFHFNKIFQHAKKFKFYKSKYEKEGVYNLNIKTLADIKKIPIVTRQELRDNIDQFDGHYYEKTGGTSGNPLFLYLDQNVWAREWAHYHKIWSKVDFSYTNAKFVFKRENNKDKFIKYDFENNEYIINTFEITDKDIKKFFNVLIKKDIKYFRGFPSTIYDFLRFLENKISDTQKATITRLIKCCFFSSELPLPHIINYMNNSWNIDFLVCYGHTEACVLAAAGVNNLNYIPEHTYGYIEEENGQLLGTSYYNYGMPLIRYRTDDLISAQKSKNGLVKSFEIVQGRVLDFFFDRKGLKVYYLDLFYDTDGEIFKYIDYLQFFQENKGQTTLLISQKVYKEIDVPSLLEFKKFDVDFKIIFLKEPLRTKRGKVPLRVDKLVYDNLKNEIINERG
tara:strand:- start:556244 stop:557590 length:1347 start_codon:yes stop_codon:yes gene_type:complete